MNERAADKRRHAKKRTSSGQTPARLVYTQAPVLMGRLVEPADGGFLVDLGANRRVLAVDASVDPALLEEAMKSGARVLVDASGGAPVIAGVIATRRALTIDPEGNVEANVRSFELSAEQVLLKVPGAFFRAKAREIEVYGDRVLTRARDLAKILAAMIKLN